jgi:glutamate-1-semialdehyde 2,1-aminomutase
MFGLFFAPSAPDNYRDWKLSDYTFYDTMAGFLHDECIICEPDSREPWFICEAHDASCLADTLEAFEKAVDLTLEAVEAEGKVAEVAE